VEKIDSSSTTTTGYRDIAYLTPQFYLQLRARRLQICY